MGRKTAQRPEKEFLGFTGTTIYGGYVQDEYLEDLQGDGGREVFDKMRRSDGQIKMILNAIKNPLRSASYKHEADKDDEDGQRLADFLQWVWFSNPAFNFTEILTELLTSLDFGFSVHETRFGVAEVPEFGQCTILNGLGFRAQKTVKRFIVDPQRSLTAIEQQVFGDTAANLSATVQIPRENLLLLVNEREGDNWEGISLLRACYGAWFRKNLFLRLQAIGIEKSSIGTPLGTYPKGASKDQKQDFISCISNLVTHESSYVTMPDGFKVEFFKNDFDAQKVREALVYEDGQMSKAAFMQFLELGQNGNSGSRALGADQSSIAMGALQYIGDMICEQMHQINKRLILWNFGPQAKVPWVRCRITPKDADKIAVMLKSYVDAKIIRPDDTLEAFVRDSSNLPEAETTREEDAEEREETATSDPSQSIPPQGGPAPANAPSGVGSQFTPQKEKTGEEPEDKEKPEAKFAEPRARWRELSVYERPLNLSDIEAGFVGQSDKMTAMIRTELHVLINQTLRGLEALLKKNPDNRIAAAREFEIPSGWAPTFTKRLLKQMEESAVIGVRQARSEMEAKRGIAVGKPLMLAEKKPPEFTVLSKNARAAMIERAAQVAEDASARAIKSVRFGVTIGVDSGMNNAQIVSDIEDPLTDYADGPQVETTARTITGQSINQGRNGFFQENLESLQGFQYSAILDDRTTDICLSLDGKIMKTDDPDLARFRPPNHFNCRSILVPITIAEEKPTYTGIEIDPTNPSLIEEYERRGKTPPDMRKIKKGWNL